MPSLADLELAYLKLKVVSPTGSSLDDYRRDFYVQEGVSLTPEMSTADMEMAFLKSVVVSPTGSSLSDYRRDWWTQELSGDTPVDPFVGPLDAYATPFRAHSLRRLLGAYTGPAIKVRRSADSVELDVGFTDLGALDEAALLAHVGAGSGFVSTWYDQSGNGRHFAQATEALQPRIVNAGVLDVVSGKPAAVFDGTDDVLLSPVAGLYSATTATVMAVLKSASSVPANATLFSECRTANNNGFWRALRGSTANWNVQATDDAGVALWASTSAGSNLFDTNLHQAFYVEASGLISTWRDTVAAHVAIAATRTAAAMTPIKSTLGAHSGSTTSSWYGGFVQELVAWASDLSANRAALSTDQKTFWGTP